MIDEKDFIEILEADEQILDDEEEEKMKAVEAETKKILLEELPSNYHSNKFTPYSKTCEEILKSIVFKHTSPSTHHLT
jgi:hypothetical protein